MIRTFAPVVRQRTATFPSRMARYFDCGQWGSGYFRTGQGPGAVVLNAMGVMLNIQTGEIYNDVRFKETTCK